LFLPLRITSMVVGCNGPPKESGTQPPLTTDLDGDGYAADADCNDNDANIHPDAEEVCDGVDNNCDEVIDDTTSGGGTFYADVDGDNYGDPTQSQVACTAPSGFVSDNTDCKDDDSAINPGAQEVCDPDGTDEDCDGLSNDADTNAQGGGTWYADQDSDGYGDPDNSVTTCDQPPGYVSEPVDCDDNNASAYPNAPEVCDGADNDCDSLTDDNDPDVTGQSPWYADNDGDGHGTSLAMIDACQAPAGYVSNSDDCDDNNGAIYPGATEICNNSDDDCDLLVDDADPDVSGQQTWYADNDQDGHGDPSSSTLACATPPGSVSNNDDCNDLAGNINPNAAELCDSIDNDCDTLVDDADPNVQQQPSWYIDNDSDGYGDSSTTVLSCSQPAGYVDNSLDPLEDAAFATLSATADLSEVIDVAGNSSVLYAVGFDAADT